MACPIRPEAFQRDEFGPVVTRPAYASGAAKRVACAAVLLAVCAAGRAHTAAAGTDTKQPTDNLYDTRFVSASDGWAVGAFGTIVRTRDGGISWHQQVSHTFEQLYGVDFADAQNGWVVGRSGLILHSSNGGEIWEIQTAPSDHHFFKVKALDAQHAWIVGDWGAMLSTHDGGKSWDDHTLTRDIILNSEAWPDADHGWIVGEAGAILATSDGGQTWTDQTSGVEKTLFGVCFTDAQHGWACGLDGLILRTADGGHSWQLQHGDAAVSALEQVGFKEASDNPSLYDIALAGKIGYAVGDNGGVFASDDGGDTWHRKEMPAAANLRWIRAVSLVKGTHGQFVGANGLTVGVAADQISLPQKDEHAAALAH
jgi:photosystem II stability/assembly factor-like uncharacterized protein